MYQLLLFLGMFEINFSIWKNTHKFVFVLDESSGYVFLFSRFNEKQLKSLALPYWIWVYFHFIIQIKKGAIMIHDCIYQFLRIFYHSRFKPQQLEMTATQLLAPALDFILTLPLVTRLFQEFSRFSNATKMKVQSKPEINE